MTPSNSHISQWCACKIHDNFKLNYIWWVAGCIHHFHCPFPIHTMIYDCNKYLLHCIQCMWHECVCINNAVHVPTCCAHISFNFSIVAKQFERLRILMKMTMDSQQWTIFNTNKTQKRIHWIWLVGRLRIYRRRENIMFNEILLNTQTHMHCYSICATTWKCASYVCNDLKRITNECEWSDYNQLARKVLTVIARAMCTLPHREDDDAATGRIHVVVISTIKRYNLYL